MEKGDHIYIYLREKVTGKKFTHHGIYIGDNRVIHYWDGKIRRGKIYKDKWLRRSIKIQEYEKCYCSERVVKRAKKRLGERKYNLILNNCEHFTYWCKTGKHKSRQVKDMIKIPKIKIPTIKLRKIKLRFF
ncbi:lecithin retinol acyltransferase family protein [Calothrix sp. PCC 6303]|uniref:lecithin retinol acyltransferase family protein n=1 Tax=Calothrix sp. PCC 6303 TaxID=1170562 RepID=UPI0002A05A02|nr:lecithin retinol acyltransferase family protein [Calothrix sp. PCC 6303]AFZ03464.1 NC domain protein [Calothrix sp. PCC 6303]